MMKKQFQERIPMLFHMFSSPKERRSAGGSCFIEIQSCRLPKNTEIRDIVSVHSLKHWNAGSLYVLGDDVPEFLSFYGDILSGGYYNNTKTGPLDLCGINFFPADRAEQITARLKQEKPPEYETLLAWLEKESDAAGFYVLGL